jgi:hypothetical protein
MSSFTPVGSTAAKAEQDNRERRGYSLSFWYGTRCDKCCGVYPESVTCGHQADEKMYYRCKACGKRTAGVFDMPWEACEAWNNGETCYENAQLSLDWLREEGEGE